ncbi:GNAT family N-acetyltransferase [Kitasatospora sp. NPDC090091]|uniref:GNAT family N-acetyltransferase n=1 Tax=Kitasatospora sp. NPDC090091 TaxID=3364081 RepID=UPI003827B422
MHIAFTTDRLTARLWEPGDLDRAYELYSRWEVMRWLGAEPRALESRAEAAQLIERFRDRSADPRYGVWALEQRETATVIGSVLLVPLPDGDGAVEVGWHLHPDSWGHGFATEAARGALAKGFAEGLAEIHAVVRPGNAPSAAVCRRLGMAAIGRTDRWYGVGMDAFLAVPTPADGAGGKSGAAGAPGDAGATRRLALDLPAELVDWVRAFAEVSHRRVEDVVGPLIAAERARVEAGWHGTPERQAR